jgi:pyruvate dehydrogenase E1 component beta subunit
MPRTVAFREALNEAMVEEMEKDDRIFLMGEEVGHYDGAYKVSKGMLKKFGEKRVIDTPIAEGGFVGVGIGAAMVGLRPIIELMTWNFSFVAADQLINNAAKIRQMSGGQFTLPVVFRGPGGSAHMLAAQHSQSTEALWAHVPGLKVVMPANPKDAKGLLKSAIRDDNPVVFFEDKMMYQLKGPVPPEEYTIPLGVADVKRAGRDITIVATSSMVHVALAAAQALEATGISAEVVDVRTTLPLDKQTLIESVKKTSRAIVVDEGYESYGVTAEIASIIADGAFYYLDAPVKRMGAMDVPVPFSPVLEDQTVPTPETVAQMAHQLCGKT